MMTAERDPLRDIFDGLVDMRQPTPGQTESARQTLVAVIQSTPARRQPRLRRLVPAAAVAVIALVIALVAAAPWSRTPAEAFLGEIAEAARTISPQEMPEGSYIYFVRNEVILTGKDEPIGNTLVDIDYLLPDRTENWWQGQTVESKTSVGEPIFFSPEDKATYYDNGVDQIDAVGQTRTQTLTGVADWVGETDWSIDPDQLAIQMREAAEADHGEQPIDVKMMNLAARILDPKLVAPPALRAAVLDVLGTLDLDQARLDGGRVSASTTYEDRYYGTVTMELVFDGDGYLVSRQETTTTGDREGSIPPGTSYATITYSPPVSVSAPGVRPSP
ncbi:MAG: hypothetical protein WBV06_20605 [Acidimicrobiia bacterium]